MPMNESTYTAKYLKIQTNMEFCISIKIDPSTGSGAFTI